MQTQTLRLAVLSYLVFVVCLWVVRILGIAGVVTLPLNFGAVGAQGESVQIGLFLMAALGVLGVNIVNRRRRRERTEPSPQCLKS